MCTRVVYVTYVRSACDTHTAHTCAHGVLCTHVACACMWQCTHACGMCTYTRVWVWVHMHRPGGGSWAAQTHTRSPQGVWASASAGTRSPSRGTHGCRRRRTLVIDMCPLSRGFVPRCSWKCQALSLCGRDFIVPKRHGGQAPVRHGGQAPASEVKWTLEDVWWVFPGHRPLGDHAGPRRLRVPGVRLLPGAL